jgi:hypothetical protein
MSVKVMLVVMACCLLVISAAPWSRAGGGRSRTFSDLLAFPSDHSPWHNVLTRKPELQDDIVKKKARSFSELLHFPRGYSRWREIQEAASQPEEA